MRIGISGKSLTSKLSGNGYYLYWLLKSYLSFQNNNEYYLFLPGKISLPADLSEHENLTLLTPACSFNKRGLRAIFEALYIPYRFSRSNLDILHMPTDGGGYLAPGCALVVSLMGIAARHFPHIHAPHIRIAQQYNMALSGKTADIVLTISESSKRDLIEMFNIPAEKIKVTYLGVGPEFMPMPRQSERAGEIREKYKLPGTYILYVGNLEPRKNITSLIQAFGLLQKHEDIDLVITGRPAWLYNSIFEAAMKSEYAKRIHFTGYVDAEDLPWIYSLVEVFVFPSLFEGFGLPNLEAMACGTPVISSNTSSIPEIVGDAGILIDPLDVEQLASSISAVISDPNLASSYRERGIERAKLFSWERTARETLAAYQQVAQ